MKRPLAYAGTAWDDPFWQVVRLVLDQLGRKNMNAFRAGAALSEIVKGTGTDAGSWLATQLADDDELEERIAEYVAFRDRLAASIYDDSLRTEEEALSQLAALSKAEVRRYGTKSADHHQSARVMVATVEALTRLTCEPLGVEFNADPQSRVLVLLGKAIWVSPRRLDGALPKLVNPVAFWEIKEYWGKTKGGSKMSDAIYEVQLVGQELRAFETLHETSEAECVQHYLFLDGKEQWGHRMSDLRRAVDLLCSGVIDELIAGRGVYDEWPPTLERLCGALSKAE